MAITVDINDTYDIKFDESLTKEDIMKLENYDPSSLTKLLNNSITEFSTIQDKMKMYYLRYTGKCVPIKNRSYPSYIKDFEKTELHNDFEKEIINTKKSYLFSRPVIRRTEEDDKQMDNIIKDFDKNNRINDLDAEVCKLASICGYGAVLLYISSKPNEFERTMNLYPWETMFITDSYGDNIMSIRFWEETDLNKKLMYKFEIYDDINLIEGEIQGGYKFNSIKPHGFDFLPVLQVKNNEEEMSDIEGVVDLIDAYDKLLSDMSSEIIGIRNAKLIAKGDGIELSKEEMNIAEKTGAYNLPSESDLSYLYKELKGFEHYFEYGEKLKENISRFSGTPDFTDLDRTGNLTNLGISFLYSKLDQRAGDFKRKFTTYLENLYQCLESSLVKRGKVIDWKMIDFLWTETKPYNEKEAAEIQEKLINTVSDTFRLSQHPNIDNPEQEKENWIKDMETKNKMESASFNFGESDETIEEEEV